MREILSLIVTPDLPWLMMASAVVIGAAHMIGCALARYYDWAHVDPPWSYVWGVGMLLTAYFAHCWANDRIAAFLPLLLIVMAGGAADVLCYHFMPRPPKPEPAKAGRPYDQLAALDNARAVLSEIDDMLADWPAEKKDPLLRAKIAEATTYVAYAQRPLADIRGDAPAVLIAEMLRRREMEG